MDPTSRRDHQADQTYGVCGENCGIYTRNIYHMRPTGVRFHEKRELSFPATDHVVTSKDNDVPIDANEGPNIVIHVNDDDNYETSDVPVQTYSF